MVQPYYSRYSPLYLKALKRLQKNIHSGRFARYTLQKKELLWKRLCRYARQAGIKIKAPVAVACLAAGLSITMPADAQMFIQRSGAANPLNNVNVTAFSKPSFMDIGGDGDLDAFIGGTYGNINYYENIGTKNLAVFVEVSGIGNPFDLVDTGDDSAPTFIDIDGDGDLDAFIGRRTNIPLYYKNTGNVTSPIFSAQIGTDNPFNGLSFSDFSTPTFLDIDGDGDEDAFIGSNEGSVNYLKNIGTVNAPVFESQFGDDNPLTVVNVGTYSTPTFVDLDADGDKDHFVGRFIGTFNYYLNTGTVTNPTFTQQTGTANPLNGMDVGQFSAPTFVDIDADGDMDVFSGTQIGTIFFYENTTIILPLQLLAFSSSMQGGYTQLQWQTADELNTKSFDVERSSDGFNFIKIATINAIGSSSNNYSISDQTVRNGKVFYRLKMIDEDGRITYSKVIWTNNKQAIRVSIYPNPVSDILHINIGSNDLLKTKALIYDANGRLRQNILITSQQQQVNIRQLAKGNYIIKFADGTAKNFIK